MIKNSFKTNIASVTVTHTIIFVLSFIMSILNARLLGPEGVGIISLLLLLQNLGVRITDFGFSRALRYYSANGEIGYYELKKIVIVLGIVVGFGTIFISLFLKYLPINIWNNIDLNVYLLFLPTMLFYVLTLYLRHLLHGQLQVMSVNISEVLEKVVYILLFILFVWYLDLGLIGFSISLSLSTLFLFVQLITKAQKYKPINQQRKVALNYKYDLKKLWSYGQWSYYSAFIEYIFINLPVLLLKSTISSFELIGYFNKAKGLSELPNRASVPISSLLFSYNAGSSIETAAKRTEILCRLSFWAITIIYFLLAIIIKPVIKFLYGIDFLPAAEVYYFLYPSAVFFVQSIYLSSAIAAQGFNKDTFTIRLYSLPFILVAVFLLITYWGIIGAAIASGFSFTVLWIQYAVKYRAIFGTRLIEFFEIKKSDIFLLKNIILEIKERFSVKRKKAKM
jgi:O-antigen/teichoic acid export membrane protein